MEAQASKRDNPFLVAAGIAIACIVVILFCAVAIVAILDWIPVSEGGAAALQTADAPAKLACAQAVACSVLSRTRAEATDYG